MVEGEIDRILRGEERRAEVALPAVGQDDDQGASRHPAGFLDGGGHGRPAAHADQQALLARQPPGRFIGLLVLDVDFLVDALLLEDLRAVGFPEVLEALNAVAEIGFDPDDAYRRIVLLQATGNAHQRAGGTHGGDQRADRAAGLAPDLLRRSVVVGLPVRGVVELIHGEIAAGVLAHQPVDFFDGAVGP